MGCCHKVKLSCRRANVFVMSFVCLLISSSTQELFKVEGRSTPKSVGSESLAVANVEEKITRAQIGSRPPRCERRCSTCGHCEAIQVPTNPTTSGSINYSTISSNAYARGDADAASNYKPMSWKCKCGNLIFNP